MEKLEKTLESKVKIRFPDCDPFNHLNNSKYIDYIISAREDQLLAFYNFDIYKLALEKGISWVVAQNQIAYLTAATLMETITVQTQLIFCNNNSLIIEALMWDEDKSILKAVLWTKFIHFNLKTKKIEIHSSELMSLFNQVQHPLNEIVSFEKRVENLKFLRKKQ